MRARRLRTYTLIRHYLAGLGVVCVLALLVAHGARRAADRWGLTSTAAAWGPSSSATAAEAVTEAVADASLATAAAELRARRLHLPVEGVRAEQLVPSFTHARGGGGGVHEALDIMAARRTPVYAVEDGQIARLFWSDAGGHTVYHFDPSTRYAYYYAHLDAYAGGLAEGQAVRRGQLIGYVGTSGNAPADAPHLHFAIFLLTPQKRWWEGTPIDPYPVLRWSLDTGTASGAGPSHDGRASLNGRTPDVTDFTVTDLDVTNLDVT